MRASGRWSIASHSSANEREKKAGNPLDVRERIENMRQRVSTGIDKTDLRGPFAE